MPVALLTFAPSNPGFPAASCHICPERNVEPPTSEANWRIMGVLWAVPVFTSSLGGSSGPCIINAALIIEQVGWRRHGNGGSDEK